MLQGLDNCKLFFCLFFLQFKVFFRAFQGEFPHAAQVVDEVQEFYIIRTKIPVALPVFSGLQHAVKFVTPGPDQ